MDTVPEQQKKSASVQIELLSPLKWAVLLFASFSCVFFWYPVLKFIPLSFGSIVAVVLLGLAVDEMIKSQVSALTRTKWVIVSMWVAFALMWMVENFLF